MTPSRNENDDLIQTGEEFPPEFGITVHGRTPEGRLAVSLPKPRVTGKDVFKQHVAECLAADRAKTSGEKEGN